MIGISNKEAILSRSEMKMVMAGSSGDGCGMCCEDDNPSNCSTCVDYCSGPDCDCGSGLHGVSCSCEGGDVEG